MVSRFAAAPPAHLSGQTNHQQRDGAGEDEESRADDAAAKPRHGKASYGSRVDRTRCGHSGLLVFMICFVTCVAERGRKEERWSETDQEPSAEAGEHCQTNHSGDQGETQNTLLGFSHLLVDVFSPNLFILGKCLAYLLAVETSSR